MQVVLCYQEHLIDGSQSIISLLIIDLAHDLVPAAAQTIIVARTVFK